MNFYCKRACCGEDWSIKDYNADNKILTDRQMEEKYHNRTPCKTQCFDCMAIVGETRIKNRKYRNKLKTLEQ
jgi:hypothetical protein